MSQGYAFGRLGEARATGGQLNATGPGTGPKRALTLLRHGFP